MNSSQEASSPKTAVTVGQMLSQNKGLVFSWLLGNLMMVGGIVAVGVFFFTYFTQEIDLPEESWVVIMLLAGIGSFVLSWFVKIPLFVRKYKNKRLRQSQYLEEQARLYQEEMDRIRKSMTPAEWELYKIQLQNQKLLQEIKNKPMGSTSGPRGVFGVVNEIGD